MGDKKFNDEQQMCRNATVSEKYIKKLQYSTSTRHSLNARHSK